MFNHEHLNHTHIITALQRATQLWPQTAAPQETDPGSDRPGARHLQQQAGSSGASRGQVQLVGRQQLEKLMLQLSGPFIRALPDYSARDIASALWSYAMCHLQPPAELVHAALQELYAWDKLQEVGVCTALLQPLLYKHCVTWQAQQLVAVRGLSAWELA